MPTPYEALYSIAQLSVSDVTESEYKRLAADVVGDPHLARRIIEWLPEACGLMLIGHMDGVGLPTTFEARDRAGEWKSFPLSRDPIVADALEFASRIIHDGPTYLFEGLAMQIVVLGRMDRALNAGESLEGTILPPPRMRSVYAEMLAS